MFPASLTGFSTGASVSAMVLNDLYLLQFIGSSLKRANSDIHNCLSPSWLRFLGLPTGQGGDRKLFHVTMGLIFCGVSVKRTAEMLAITLMLPRS